MVNLPDILHIYYKVLKKKKCFSTAAGYKSGHSEFFRDISGENLSHSPRMGEELCGRT